MKPRVKKQNKMNQARTSNRNDKSKAGNPNTNGYPRQPQSTKTHDLHIAQVFRENLTPVDILADKQLRLKIAAMVKGLTEYSSTLVLYPAQLESFVNESLNQTKATCFQYTNFITQKVQTEETISNLVCLSYPNHSLLELSPVANQFYKTEMIAFKTGTRFETRRFGTLDFQTQVKVFDDEKLQHLAEYLREELIKDAVIHAINQFDELKSIYLFMDIPIPNLKLSHVLDIDQVLPVARYLHDHYDECKSQFAKEEILF